MPAIRAVSYELYQKFVSPYGVDVSFGGGKSWSEWFLTQNLVGGSGSGVIRYIFTHMLKLFFVIFPFV